MDRILSIEYNKCENSGTSILSVVDPDTYRVIFTVHNKEADNLYEYIVNFENKNYTTTAKNISGREYVEKFGECPICENCPHGCPLDKEKK